MAGSDQPIIPLWAESKAKKQVDIVQEAARALADAERLRASQPIAKMRECDLEAEQLRLEEMLAEETLTVEDFRRLREIDFYLAGMRERREYGWSRDEWSSESIGDDGP